MFSNVASHQGEFNKFQHIHRGLHMHIHMHTHSGMHKQLMKVAHKQTNWDSNRCNHATSHPHSHKHVYSLSAHTHTRVTHRMFGVQNDLPRVPFSRPSPWQLTDTQHSTIPLRVTIANTVQGCIYVCVMDWPQDSAGLPNWSLERCWKSVCAWSHFKDLQCLLSALCEAEKTLTLSTVINTSVCACHAFRFKIIDVFLLTNPKHSKNSMTTKHLQVKKNPQRTHNQLLTEYCLLFKILHDIFVTCFWIFTSSVQRFWGWEQQAGWESPRDVLSHKNCWLWWKCRITAATISRLIHREKIGDYFA